MVGLGVKLLCYSITCLRVCNKEGALFVPDPVQEDSNVDIVQLFDGSHPNVTWCLFMVLIFISLMTNDIEHLFMCLLFYFKPVCFIELSILTPFRRKFINYQLIRNANILPQSFKISSVTVYLQYYFVSAWCLDHHILYPATEVMD